MPTNYFTTFKIKRIKISNESYKINKAYRDWRVQTNIKSVDSIIIEGRLTCGYRELK